MFGGLGFLATIDVRATSPVFTEVAFQDFTDMDERYKGHPIEVGKDSKLQSMILSRVVGFIYSTIVSGQSEKGGE